MPRPGARNIHRLPENGASVIAYTAILTSYAVRGRGAEDGLAILEALTLVSTTIYGLHHLCDALAGTVVAVFAIRVTAWLDRWFPVCKRGYG